MERIFQRMIQNNFSELVGSNISASVPVPQSLINELIEAALRGNKNINSLRISLHAQNRASVHLKTTLLPWPLNLKLKLDDSVDFASFGSPKMRAWLESHRLLGGLGSFLNVLPEGVKLYGDQIVVDIGSFLRAPEQRQILHLIKVIDIRTDEGKLILDVTAAVES